MGYDFETTHENILRSAKEAFLEKGFRDASIRQICSQAGMTNGVFYTHFKSKEDLFDAIVGPALEEFFRMYAGEAEQYTMFRSAADLEHVLTRSFSSLDILIHFVYEHEDVFRLLLQSSGGTAYEGFPRQLIEEETKETMAFFEQCRPFMTRPENISENLAGLSASFTITSVFKCFLNGMPEEETLQQTRVACEYCIAGMKKVLGF